MAGRRRGWFRSPDNPEWVQRIRDALTAAFLDMDRRQSAAQAGAEAADQVFPERGIGARWEPVRAVCYAAAGAYLAMNEELAAESVPPQGEARAEAVLRQLARASSGVDGFYQGNRGPLEEAVAVLDSIPRLVAEAAVPAARVREEAANSTYARYPSVRAALLAVDEAMITSADPAAGALARRDAARRLTTAAAELSDVLAHAPSQRAKATTALASARTRLSAARTRADRLDPAYSALLREFAAANSDDLANNGRESSVAMAAAQSALDRAGAALSEDDPEQALELITSAREHLGAADHSVDAVTKRLTLLREVRADPQRFAEAARFRLRDARMLAHGGGHTAEWGPALDAQAARVERSVQRLTGPHPDYLAYVTELDSVTGFVAGVVERMRKQTGQRRQ
ncbi:hypothetical protein D5S18_11760 [Nocardia panacis]|uniref:Uncharacterized protein n=1 Tax=Nocardia panacis TaxID=2340916 RepID=A0A3A4KMV7_9NOCA|nr:hypothetical protein [Nocardia panacis]RJO76888.1 hypothetical protein D5S18_11760 [Nocardia panacis]